MIYDVLGFSDRRVFDAKNLRCHDNLQRICSSQSEIYARASKIFHLLQNNYIVYTFRNFYILKK